MGDWFTFENTGIAIICVCMVFTLIIKLYDRHQWNKRAESRDCSCFHIPDRHNPDCELGLGGKNG